MNLAKHLLGGAALAALVLQPGLAQEAAPESGPTSADTVIATVNGQEITLGHMIVARSRLPEQYQALPDEALYEGLLDQLIQQIALGARVDGRLSHGSELALENERRAFLAGEAASEIVETAVTEEALAAAYAERFAEAEPSREFNAAHILVETKDEAAAIKTRLDDGADFAELARTRSTGPSGPNGGDLGWFEKGMMVAPFEEAVLALEPGEISGPVQTQFGWHIVKLIDSRLQEAPPLDAVRGDLTEELRREAIDTALAEATAAAEVTMAEVKVDPALLRDLDLVSD